MRSREKRAAYDDGVAKGFYATRDEALRHGLVESWRHHRGKYCTVRLDLLDSDDRRPDTGSMDPDADETTKGDDLAAGDNPEEGDDGESS